MSIFYSEIDENGVIVNSLFTQDPNQIVPAGHRLVVDDPSSFEYNSFTQIRKRVEPVIGSSVEYTIETRPAIVKVFEELNCPVVVDIDKWKYLTPVDVSFPGIKIFCYTLPVNEPILWRYKPFQIADFYHRQVCVGGQIQINFTNNALPMQIMKPGKVWPIAADYSQLHEFTTLAMSPNTKMYCILGNKTHRVVEDINGFISVGGAKFRLDIVI